MKNYPYPNQSKLDNLEYGLETIKRFLYQNKILKPTILINYKLLSKGVFIYDQFKNHKIEINLKKCKSPVVTPGFSWSFTGYKSDVTPSGVLAHEIGHYIDYLSNWSHNKNLPSNKKITSYEPNKLESFAETMRLFILNPDLLKTKWIERYNYIIQLGFKPSITDSWQEVLINAHEKIINQCKK